MSLTIKELADFFGIEWTKEPGLVLERVSSFENAMPGSITLATGTNRENLSKSQASAFIVDIKTVVPAERQKYSLLIAESPKVIFARTIEILHPVLHRAASIAPDFIHGEGTIIAPDVTIYPRVTVGKKCYIGERTKLYPGVVLGDKVTIGDDCILYPNVTVYDGTTIGNKVIIHGGAVIGSDGFGFAKDMGYTNIKIPHIGNVIIEDTVEIGANACIDRATIDSTIIGFGTKIDNLVHIAHNCEIGKNTLIAAQVGLSGSVKVGNHVTIAGQVGTNPRIEIGDSSLIAGQSGVSKSVAPGEKVSGTPIQSFREWKRNHAYITQLPRKLPELESRIEALEKSCMDSSDMSSEPTNSTKEHTA